MKQSRRKIIGVTGGVGAGKSAVMDLLKNEFGAEVILADLVGHDLMQPGCENYRQIVEAFGTDILLPDGEIDHKALAQIVFGDKKQLERLNNITHPNIRKEIFARIDRIQEEGRAAFVAVEAALLLEEGYQHEFDEMWYVYVDEETRIRRLMESRGYSEEKCREIMKKQLPEEVFRAECGVVIDNHLDLEYTRKQIAAAVASLLAE